MNSFLIVGAITLLLVTVPMQLHAKPYYHGPYAEVTSEMVGKAIEKLLKSMTNKVDEQHLNSMTDEADADQYIWADEQGNSNTDKADADLYIWADEQLDSNTDKADADQYIWADEQLDSNTDKADAENIYKNELLSSMTHQATAQVRGVNINNCGVAGFITNLVLQNVLRRFNNHFGVLVDCNAPQGCLTVRVDVPGDVRKTEVNVCRRSGGRNCVRVIAESSPTCTGRRIPIIIPLPGGRPRAILIRITIGQNCAHVRVLTPLQTCP